MAGGRRNKRGGKSKQRQSAPKDGHNDDAVRSDELAEELTALEAIFQDDFILISEKPFVEFRINLRPHTVEDEDYLSAELLVRCLPGYPLRPPKLQVSSKKGLTSEQLQYLHSILVEQAVSLARERRVMIFNLTETAQEFLSDQHRHVDSVEQTTEVKGGLDASSKSTEDSSDGVTTSTLDTRHDEPELEDSIYLDLFNNLWGAGDVQLEAAHVSHDHVETSQSNNALREKRRFLEIQASKATKMSSFQESTSSRLSGVHFLKLSNRLVKGNKQVELPEIMEEPVEDSELEKRAQLKRTPATSASELLRKVHSGLIAPRQSGKSSGNTDSSSTDDTIDCAIKDGLATYGGSAPAETPVNEDVAIQSVQKDLILIYLLQLVCGPRGPLSDALSALSSELRESGVLSQWAYNLLTFQPQLLIPTFRRMFGQMLKDIETTSASAQRLSVVSGVQTLSS